MNEADDRLSGVGLAERVGVTRQAIHALEAGRYSPALLLSPRIARAFGVEDVFRFEDGSMPSANP